VDSGFPSIGDRYTIRQEHRGRTCIQCKDTTRASRKDLYTMQRYNRSIEEGLVYNAKIQQEHRGRTRIRCKHTTWIHQLAYLLVVFAGLPSRLLPILSTGIASPKFFLSSFLNPLACRRHPCRLALVHDIQLCPFLIRHSIPELQCDLQ